MQKIIDRADSRGYADHGWLQTYHTFSFADYYNPQRMRFGALRVLNDDTVAGGEGFGMHPHDNMEIVSIPLAGVLRHSDSMGHTSLLHAGEIQVMTAGTGIVHSEYNASMQEPVRFLQIWVFPEEKNLTPRYSQVRLNEAESDRPRLIVAPEGSEHVGWIHRKAWFHTLRLSGESEVPFRLQRPSDGLYLFVIDGEIEADGERLNRRDGMGLIQPGELALRGRQGAEVLLMEVPMD